MAADAADFSRLMEQDEEATLQAFQACRDVIRETVPGHGGRIFGETGDGALAEFASPVEAVRCAVKIHRAVDQRNAGIDGERQLKFRIGINLGDVMIDEENLLGDDVNLAARIEEVAVPGGTFVSGAVFDCVDGKLAYDFDFVGEQSFKNIVRPVRLYRVHAADMPAPGYRQARRGGALPAPNRPSIAVLPFRNRDNNPDDAYFSAGMTEDIITELSRFRSLFVIASRSSFTYHDGERDYPSIGRELGVQYLLDGSIRRNGDRVRITTQLIGTDRSQPLWAERYDHDVSHLFDVQDEVVQTIVSTLAGRLESAGAERAREKPTDNMRAYDYFLRGLAQFNRLTKNDNLRAREMFQQAVGADPRFAAGHSYLAATYLYEWLWHSSDDALDEAERLAQKSLQLDENDGRSHLIFGRVQLYRWNFDVAEYHLRKSLDLNPNDANTLAHYGLLSAFAGRPEEGVDWISKAMRLNPYHPDWYCEDLGQALFLSERFHDAVGAFHRIATPPFWVKAWLAAAHAHLGNDEAAKAVARDVTAEAPDVDWQRYARDDEPIRLDSHRNLWLDGLRKAGFPV